MFRNFVFLQDAKRGVSFIDFPPVLQLQLKRFEYDFIRDTMVKVSICGIYADIVLLFILLLSYVVIRF